MVNSGNKSYLIMNKIKKMIDIAIENKKKYNIRFNV